MTDAYALEDCWIAAINALPDPRPIAALLRGDVPMTRGARNHLAEMFHPGDPPITDQRLVVRRNPDFDRMIRQLGATATYRRALADGSSVREAAEMAGQEAGITDRQAFRWVRENTPERLQGRLRGADILVLPNVSKKSSDAMVGDDSANNLVIGFMSISS